MDFGAETPYTSLPVLRGLVEEAGGKRIEGSELTQLIFFPDVPPDEYYVFLVQASNEEGSATPASIEGTDVPRDFYTAYGFLRLDADAMADVIFREARKQAGTSGEEKLRELFGEGAIEIYTFTRTTQQQLRIALAALDIALTISQE